MPNNFRHIGLIKLMLPNAKVIDARRDPMSCCFSGFKQLFAEGQMFSYDQEDIAQYYLDYVRLMGHWDEVIPGYVLRGMRTWWLTLRLRFGGCSTSAGSPLRTPALNFIKQNAMCERHHRNR